jgi:hypothetical protein
MSLADTFAPVEPRYVAQVMAATWGHLYPELGCRYKGRIKFVIAAYGGDHCILAADWGTLQDSPVLYDAMMTVFEKPELKWRSKYAIMGEVRRDVFEWEGELIVHKNGTFRLSKGKIRTILKME